MLRRLARRRGQSALELALVFPVFIVVMFACFDLAVIQTALIDTMAITRNASRTMSLTASDEQGSLALYTGYKAAHVLAKNTGAKYAKFGIEEATPNAPGCDQVGDPSKSRCSFGTKISGGKGAYFSGKDFHIANGGQVANAPQVVQICSAIKPFVPSLWGQKEVNICASYFSFRQYQTH